MSRKVAVVTGAGRGIGLAIAHALADAGADLCLCARSADQLKAAETELRSKARVVALTTDVSNAVEVKRLFARCRAELGPIDWLVNNAGILRAADFLHVTEADFDAVLRVNLKGSFLVGQAVARTMAAAGGSGAIVNMSSVNGVLAIPNISSYNVSKGGVNQLTRVMALALADRNIRANAVAPGTIATELAAKAVLTSDEARNKIMSRTPMKRLGEPSEIADVVAWLASDAASYVTGEIVTVDGGRMTLNYTVPV